MWLFTIQIHQSDEAVETPTASLLSGKTTPNEYPGYDSKQSDGEVPVIGEIWGMLSTSPLWSIPGPVWPGVVTPDRVLSMGQIEVNYVLT